MNVFYYSPKQWPSKILLSLTSDIEPFFLPSVRGGGRERGGRGLDGNTKVTEERSLLSKKIDAVVTNKASVTSRKLDSDEDRFWFTDYFSSDNEKERELKIHLISL